MKYGFHTSQMRLIGVGAESCDPHLTVTSHLCAAGNFWPTMCNTRYKRTQCCRQQRGASIVPANE